MADVLVKTFWNAFSSTNVIQILLKFVAKGLIDIKWR